MSIWQTESWQNMLVSSGQSEEYFMIERDIVAASSPLGGENGERSESGTKIFVEKRRVSLGEYGLFVIGFEGELDEDLQESLQELCKEENCLFLQVETIDYFAVSSPLGGENGERCLVENEVFTKNKFYKKFIPPYTALIDLTLGEEEILKAMKPKGRYNIKLARKKGVVVEQVDKNSWNTKIFFELMQMTTQRDNFSGNTLEYYEKFLQQENSFLLFAYYQEKVIAAGIFMQDKDVMYYYYGASNHEYRSLMAPYLLQWTALIQAKKSGAKIYDFLGVAGDDEKNSSLAGVTDFKMKLSPKKTLISGSYLFINKKIKYQVIKLLRRLKK